jgi:proteasome activator subunit 4
MKSLSWRFEPWAPKYNELFWSSLDSPFQEVRSAVAECLRFLVDLQLHPSFPSVTALVQQSTSMAESGSGVLLLDVKDDLRERAQHVHQQLGEWRAVRKPLASGEQPYDEASLTVLNWLFTSAQGASCGLLMSVASHRTPRLASDPSLPVHHHPPRRLLRYAGCPG